MKGWLFLVIAIVGEVIATSALKSSEGFTKLAPSAVVIIGYGIAFYFLSLVLKSIPAGADASANNAKDDDVVDAEFEEVKDKK